MKSSISFCSNPVESRRKTPMVLVPKRRKASSVMKKEGAWLSGPKAAMREKVLNPNGILSANPTMAGGMTG
jgi:hypothetical protein